ncbi:hypothetical protein Bbelb_300240 [Branchiostoma belcheri]|nr:hypothetical protein Bbelb_300240 [Branchiostoma belcheri]
MSRCIHPLTPGNETCIMLITASQNGPRSNSPEIPGGSSGRASDHSAFTAKIKIKPRTCEFEEGTVVFKCVPLPSVRNRRFGETVRARFTPSNVLYTKPAYSTRHVHALILFSAHETHSATIFARSLPPFSLPPFRETPPSGEQDRWPGPRAYTSARSDRWSPGFTCGDSGRFEPTGFF